jgi:hypothetical protein
MRHRVEGVQGEIQQDLADQFRISLQFDRQGWDLAVE